MRISLRQPLRDGGEGLGVGGREVEVREERGEGREQRGREVERGREGG